MFLCIAMNAYGPHSDIQRLAYFTDKFTDSAQCDKTRQMQLEEPVLSRDKALNENCVVEILGIYVGHAFVIAHHFGRPAQPGQDNGTLFLVAVEPR
jgi:hypothetical protein